jgi:hypothetical protein
VGNRNGTLCNKELFFQYTGLTEDAIKSWTDWDVPDEAVKKLY